MRIQPVEKAASRLLSGRGHLNPVEARYFALVTMYGIDFLFN